MSLSQRAIDAMLWRRDNPDKWLAWYIPFQADAMVRIFNARAKKLARRSQNGGPALHTPCSCIHLKTES